MASGKGTLGFAGPPLKLDQGSTASHINSFAAGGCLALGIRFAGSSNEGARAVLHKYVVRFLEAKLRAPDPANGANYNDPFITLMTLMFTCHLPYLECAYGAALQCFYPSPVLQLWCFRAAMQRG